jgi:hypothetical protein
VQENDPALIEESQGRRQLLIYRLTGMAERLMVLMAESAFIFESYYSG